MSKMKFSDEQELAITAKGTNYLISAGAGSGKTAVLTERIYRIAKEEKRLDQFLVLTFTNLAAMEMKSRVRQKLLDDPETIFLASEVDNSHIETIDSFSLYLAKKYFYRLGISKDIAIVDNSILSIKRKLFLDEIFEELFERRDPNFLNLIDNYVSKNTDALKDYIISILSTGDKKADNYAFFSHLRNDFFNEDVINEGIASLMMEIKDNLEFVRSKAEELEDVDDSDQICDFIDSLLMINDYDKLYSILSDPDLSKFPNKPKTKTDDADYRAKIAKFYKDKIKISEDNDLGNKEDIKRQYYEVAPFIQTIIDIAINVEKRLDEFKKARNAYSFGDIARFVLKLLKDEDIRIEISNHFDYIMVDEYQDTNDIQETIISSISKNNVYMVGDVKQSIYRFRGADCHIFQEKYENYKLNRGGKEIDLNTSYRSRKEVVDFINELFSQLMIKKINAIDYSNGHHFGFGRKEFEENKPNCSYKPEVYQYEYEKSDETVDKEVEIIVKDILKRKRDKYQVYDAKNKCGRDIEYKDFAIIIDRGSSFDTYRRKFAEANIPIKVESKETLFKSDVASVVKNLVKMLYYSLNNDYSAPYRHAYMSVARSFLIEYKDDVLYEIFKKESFLVEPFAQKIELIKEKLRYQPNKEILLSIYEEFDIYSSLSKITQYYANAHKLEYLLSLAESMDALNYTLEDFVTYFDDLNELDQDIDYSDSDSQENSVTLINIHKSKGLEYGVIYYPGLTKQFNRQDINTAFLFSDRYGAIIPSSTENKSSLFIHLIKEELTKADFEEKLRLLYVALTRAKEKIILVSGHKVNEQRFVKPSNSKTMNDILSITDVLEKYATSYTLENISIDSTQSERSVNKVKLKSIEVPIKVVEHTRASKEVDEEANEAILDFGSELHAYLEKMDLTTKSTDYVKNRQMKKYVYNVMNSSIFNGVSNEQVRHEYRFYDEENNIQGYIDALIVKDNEIDIVDFKLKNIDESEYDRQLRIYKSYISKLTSLPVRMFLLAAITGISREVKDE